MRAFAYPIGEPVNEYGLVELKEFSISADAASIRALANFMLTAAEKMEAMGEKYDHLHAQDAIKEWHEAWPDLVICGPVKNEL
jgi:hypothetical protein